MDILNSVNEVRALLADRLTSSRSYALAATKPVQSRLKNVKHPINRSKFMELIVEYVKLEYGMNHPLLSNEVHALASMFDALARYESAWNFAATSSASTNPMGVLQWTRYTRRACVNRIPRILKSLNQALINTGASNVVLTSTNTSVFNTDYYVQAAYFAALLHMIMFDGKYSVTKMMTDDFSNLKYPDKFNYLNEFALLHTNIPCAGLSAVMLLILLHWSYGAAAFSSAYNWANRAGILAKSQNPDQASFDNEILICLTAGLSSYLNVKPIISDLWR